MLHFIKQHAQEAHFSDVELVKIELAVEEALVNIINYAYPQQRGEIEIECAICEKGGILITLTDRGISYNPLANNKVFNPSAIHEHQGIGGYGIFFILKIMDEVKYNRNDDSNCLSMMKYRTHQLER